MNNNFFKKCLVTIAIISLLGLLLLICLYQRTNDIKKERELGKSPSLKHEFNQSTPSRPQRETEPPKLKFKTTQSHFNQVEAYVLSETDDKSLLPNNLSQEEKIEIDKIRKSWEQILGFIKKDQKNIDEYQQKCDNYNHEIKEIKDKFPSLKTQQTNLQKKHDDKVQEINQVKSQLQNKKSQLQTQGISIYNNPEIDKLQAEISKLQDEEIEIIKQIRQVKIEIGKLEAAQKKYEDMLSNAIKLRDSLQRDYDKSQKDDQKQTISSLKSLYNITSTEK
ncbi:hypothetical protein HGD80_01135 [Paulownia witches'-broom phytoplasma]|uniref:Effector n=2 Tax=Paulownia witches'-broom phytoplasma TaxID=39647 RepID=A0ABX8TRJ9_9MOLU|nr:hypothetical protein [Paulownia witches'-broom phytoplasma]QYC31201.1 hypothetical protein HGD80_01135 [Paulownia witches'-broom phytoplasma]